MGGGSWSSDAYTSGTRHRLAKGLADFGYDQDIKTGKASGIHPDLDPSKMKDGIRESRDSADHPESLPIIMIFDVTGSMGRIPEMLQKKLANLMDIVISKAGIANPQILMGAVGDATCDRYPLQVGQFESDNRLDEQLRNIILEGGGGGQVMESYGFAYRFAARHTATDSFEKRGKKGYLFTMGDEGYWPVLQSEQISAIFGEHATEGESVDMLLTETLEQWEVFHLFAMDGSYPDRIDVHDSWSKLLGERFVKVNDSSLVCEIIAGLIYALESAKSVDQIVTDLGISDPSMINEVSGAIVPVVASRVPSHMAQGNLPEEHGTGNDPLSKV